MPVRWVLLAACLAFTACPPEAPCGPDTCVGCCDGERGCLLGSSHDACGGGGGACLVCPARDVCQAHACQGPPDAGPPPIEVPDGGCACGYGCCTAEGTCEPGTTPWACGAEGGTCAVCAAGQRCEARACTQASCGGCVDPAGVCQAGAQAQACGADGGLCRSCAPGEACQDGACQRAGCSALLCPEGCCTRAGQCVTSSTQTCGLGGVTCAACAPGQQCVMGSCR